MIVFFYEKVRLKRGAWQTVSIVLLIAFLCAFFTLFDGFICQKEQDMESAYAVIPVTVVVSNLTGTKTDDLKITDYIIKDTTNQFLPQIKQRVLFRPQRQKNCRKILIIMVMSY